MARIGLFGGTFNPIHRGHIAVARQLRVDFPLDRIYLIPAHIPPHKDRGALAPAAHRQAMIQLALAEIADQGLLLSDAELRREGPSYTVDTVESFRQAHAPEDELYLVMGADAFLELDAWRHWRALLCAVSLIVMSRPGPGSERNWETSAHWKRLAAYACERLDGAYRLLAGPFRLEHPHLPSIFFASVPAWDLSSSQVRRCLQGGESIVHLVPEPVAAYIESKGLYR
ncbi:MAG: nicotinate (nicotinamide) nucleotide adenylyltransferase [Desulfosarcinaceae bacterium]|nr:nicotinate (nicotinamide) nucleotide adenylyltransferase [Desulfosarcinaceae bacterium]